MSRAPQQMSQQFSMPELLAHALVIELEAVQSYLDLAAQMHECGNDPVAARTAQSTPCCVCEQAGDTVLPEFAPWEYRWPGFEAPENIDAAGIHYLMTPHQALELALENEMNAKKFFEDIANNLPTIITE